MCQLNMLSNKHNKITCFNSILTQEVVNIWMYLSNITLKYLVKERCVSASRGQKIPPDQLCSSSRIPCTPVDASGVIPSRSLVRTTLWASSGTLTCNTFGTFFALSQMSPHPRRIIGICLRCLN